MSKKAMMLLAVFAALLLFGVLSLIDAHRERRASQRADEQMRTLFETEAADVTPAPTPVKIRKPEPVRKPTDTPADEIETEAPANTAVSSPALTQRLAEQTYPGNPDRKISPRFQRIREENEDIVGWLTIGNMIDEAVTQRDNEFYMDHNVKGEEDLSGAVFLDAIVSLTTRPYALILYGHNMRNGARFGSLRNYENISFYRNSPLISFDTLYEEGEYAVFSVGTVSLEETAPNYLDFFWLDSRRTDERLQAIRTLQNVSVYTSPVEVWADDQLLILVTCVENDMERRLVAARRLREDEDPVTIKKQAETIQRKRGSPPA